MAFPGPKSGSAPRTLRGESLKKGAASQGFTERAEYDTLGGAPVTMKTPARVYKDVGVHVSPSGPTPINTKTKFQK